MSDQQGMISKTMATCHQLKKSQTLICLGMKSNRFTSNRMLSKANIIVNFALKKW